MVGKGASKKTTKTASSKKISPKTDQSLAARKGKEEFPVDPAKGAPAFSAIDSGKFWDLHLTNTDFVVMRKRNGIAKKIITKIKRDLFKAPFISGNTAVDQLRREFDLDAVAAFAWDSAATSGFSLIYVGYPDVQTIKDYSNEAPLNQTPEYFFVIPASWIAEDVKQEGQNDDNVVYKIYQENGQTFSIHRSRIIRVTLNEEEDSLLLGAYNSLDVADNMLWAVGQTLFRNGAGFPHLRVSNPKNVKEGGVKVPEVKWLQDKGALNDVTTMMGFISDDRYKIEFLGAEGKAIKPAEYWEVCLDQLSMSTDIPKDLLRGISAGAVTGSEVNIKEYNAVIRGKQIQEVAPIYSAMLLRLAIPQVDYDFPPIFEQDQKEIAETLKADMEAMGIAVDRGIFTSEVAQKILINKYPSLEEFSGSAKDSCSCTKTKIEAMKKKFDVPDYVMDELFKKAMDEDSTLSEGVQAIEDEWMKEFDKQFKGTRDQVVLSLEGLNK